MLSFMLSENTTILNCLGSFKAKDNSILICCKKSKESGDKETLKSAFYTLVFHRIILYTKHCRLILSTKDLFVLIAKKNLKLTETTEQAF